MSKDRNTTSVQIGRIYEPSIDGIASAPEEALAVQTRAMREAEKEKNFEGIDEPDSEANESDKDQPMSERSDEDEAEDDWSIPILQYLDKGTLPADVKEARKLESKAAMYSLRDGILYRRSFLGPLMRCQTEGKRILHDIHRGKAGNHSVRRSLVIKAKTQGYYWLSMDEDAKNVARCCERCQRYARKIKAPVTELNSVIGPWPFAKWGVDTVRNTSGHSLRQWKTVGREEHRHAL
ncbi:uncharacterized protein LOC113331597 [Papaver somniferum]|uniref:uncharacterized protein LOC113331597 n=1 Tax=Papaver somniferum TaxID=3469 RepID=UPI000E6F52EE|nr:uncharacterized protein LOC113331597 [Papaver somniferum]